MTLKVSIKMLLYNENRSINTAWYICILILITWAFFHFLFIKSPEPLLPSPSAFEWPAIDMMVYFEREADPQFLQNDFFTNSSHELSPRQIFGGIITTLTKI